MPNSRKDKASETRGRYDTGGSAEIKKFHELTAGVVRVGTLIDETRMSAGGGPGPNLYKSRKSFIINAVGAVEAEFLHGLDKPATAEGFFHVQATPQYYDESLVQLRDFRVYDGFPDKVRAYAYCSFLSGAVPLPVIIPVDITITRVFW